MSDFVIDTLLSNRPWATNWQYHFIINPKIRRNAAPVMADALVWCGDQFGAMAISQGRWTRDGWTIRMNSETDATAFKIRWC